MPISLINRIDELKLKNNSRFNEVKLKFEQDLGVVGLIIQSLIKIYEIGVVVDICAERFG